MKTNPDFEGEEALLNAVLGDESWQTTNAAGKAAAVGTFRARQRARRAGYIAGQADRVPDDDVAAADLTRLHSGDDTVVDDEPVPAAVHGRHEAVDCLGMRGPAPRARPGAAAGPDPDVILVHAAVPGPGCHYAGARICVQHRLNPGYVLPTVAAFRTRIPSVTSPRTAAAITSL